MSCLYTYLWRKTIGQSLASAFRCMHAHSVSSAAVAGKKTSNSKRIGARITCPCHNLFTGIAGSSPASSAVRRDALAEGLDSQVSLALRARGGRDARGPSEGLECG